MGPYLSKKDAAAICGYSAKYFTSIVEKYQIRRYGPNLNKFKEEDLHIFMENPTHFIQHTKKHKSLQPAKKKFTPIQI